MFIQFLVVNESGLCNYVCIVFLWHLVGKQNYGFRTRFSWTIDDNRLGTIDAFWCKHVAGGKSASIYRWSRLSVITVDDSKWLIRTCTPWIIHENSSLQHIAAWSLFQILFWTTGVFQQACWNHLFDLRLIANNFCVLYHIGDGLESSGFKNRTPMRVKQQDPFRKIKVRNGKRRLPVQVTTYADC